jgi:hypothetical protein
MPGEGFRIFFPTTPPAPRFGRWREKATTLSGIFRRTIRNIPRFDLSLPLKSAFQRGTLIAEIEARSFKQVSTASGSKWIRDKSGARYRLRY